MLYTEDINRKCRYNASSKNLLQLSKLIAVLGDYLPIHEMQRA